MMREVRPWLLSLLLSHAFLFAASPTPAAAQATRQVVGRYTFGGSFQTVAFVEGAVGVEDALFAAFAESLQSIVLTLYSDDRFDLQFPSGRFVLSMAGGRFVTAQDGTRFLHFGVPLAVGLADTLDGVLYPERLDPATLPPRLSFTLVQVNAATQVRITWQAIVVLRAVAL